MASDWFYSMPSYFTRNFEKVTKAFLTQYTSRQEVNKNNHHLCQNETVTASSPKLATSRASWQSFQLSCDEDISALTFISGLQISHPLYKYLLKHDVTRMSEVLSQAQPYIQLETMKSSVSHSLKRSNDGGKLNSQR